jgi:hypothetical protein
MNPWHKVLNHLCKPTREVVCGECSIIYESPLIEEIKDPIEHYSKNCQWCGKNCGDDYKHKENHVYFHSSYNR